MSTEGRRAPRLDARSRLATVRVRTTLVAVAVVGLALVVAAVALVTSLRRSLTADLERALELRAEDVVTALEAGAPPGSLALDEGDDRLVQIVAPDGRVVAASRNLATGQPVASIPPGSSQRVDVAVADDGGREQENFFVLARAATTEEGRVTVLVGRASEFVTESTGFVAGVMFLGLPFLIALVGATAWTLVGRALRPVEAIRDEVDRISERALGRRVPVPGTGDEIARLAETMNRMLERLDDAQARQRRFVSDAGHELRSPITAIRHHAEVALTHPDQNSLDELADVVLEEGERLQRLVDDLLLLAMADEGSLSVTREPVDVDDLVFEEADRLRRPTGPTVDTSAVSAGRVTGDAGRLRRLVRNLGDNAFRHARSTVVFALGETRGSVVLVVEDDGPGIAPRDRERVFERFVRLDDARGREEGGAGLGLAIVLEIARAHGATVDVDESALGGARFTVTFPAPA